MWNDFLAAYTRLATPDFPRAALLYSRHWAPNTKQRRMMTNHSHGAERLQRVATVTDHAPSVAVVSLSNWNHGGTWTQKIYRPTELKLAFKWLNDSAQFDCESTLARFFELGSDISANFEPQVSLG